MKQSNESTGKEKSKLSFNSTIQAQVKSNTKLNTKEKRPSANESATKLKKARSDLMPKKASYPRRSPRGKNGIRNQTSTIQIIPKRPESILNITKRKCPKTKSPTSRSFTQRKGSYGLTVCNQDVVPSSSPDNLKRGLSKNPIPVEVNDYLISRNYTAVRFLGEGSSAKVYEVKTPDGQLLAAKVLPKAIGIGTEELKLVALLKHRYIASIETIFSTIDYSIIIFELATEGDLITYVERLAQPNVPQARLWFENIAEAVSYIHELGVAHRDIKADNVLLFKTNDSNNSKKIIAKLSDFGAATRSVDPTTQKIIFCTSSFGGTFEYKAPECFGQSLSFDPFAADVFSLGVLLYTLVTHEFPFGGNDEHRTEAGMAAIKAKIIDKKWKVNDDIQADNYLHSLLRQMLNPDTFERITAPQVLANPWLAKATITTVSSNQKR